MANGSLRTGETEELLNTSQPAREWNHQRFKEDSREWMITLGKNQDRRRGCAETTTRRTTIQVDSLYRWKWNRDGRYTRKFAPEDADDFMAEMAADRSQSASTLLTYVKTIKRLFKYDSYNPREDIEWDCSIKLSEWLADECTLWIYR